MLVPNTILKRLYTLGSLVSDGGLTSFTVKNRLKAAILKGLDSLEIDGQAIAANRISLSLPSSETCSADTLNNGPDISFGLGAEVKLTIQDLPLKPDQEYRITLALDVQPFGKISFTINDQAKKASEHEGLIPRSAENDYQQDIIRARQEFIRAYTHTQPEHIFQHSFDPAITAGNIEHFVGVAQVPLGIAGPIKINGEHANGEFLIPLATAEGTLVASYNRGMKLINACGGAKVTVQDDAMQRAPVFVFDSAREARDFASWIDQHIEQIRIEAENSDPFVKLKYIDTLLSNKFTFLRFNFATGDAAGQNMVGQATFAACNWILANAADIRNFYLEGNVATDKKASQINIMRTRGKRVTAEVTVPREILRDVMRIDPKQVDTHGRIAAVGSFLAGVNNTGLHAANGITAMFIATGQDVANVAESSTGILYSELTDDGGLYLSITLPSLIVATFGGGTGLATQRECLEMLGCHGKGTVRKLAEIIAATVLAGELSLAGAISSLDWVSSHEQYGRNR